MASKVMITLLVLLVATVTATSVYRGLDRDSWSILNGRNSDSNECVAHVFELLVENEGYHERAYDHRNGYRAVAAGYNLDDEKETRREELEKVGASYDEVYRGTEFLSDRQMVVLTIKDAQRALHRATQNVKPLHGFCCTVRAVFAYVQHTSIATDHKFPMLDMEETIRKVKSKDYKSAAQALQLTEWCSKEAWRCEDHVAIVATGCLPGDRSGGLVASELGRFNSRTDCTPGDQ